MNIQLQNVSKSYGHVRALKPITVSIPSGKFTTILGPSGCGKTTLLRIIAGLEEPNNGEVYFNDTCIYSKKKKIEVQTYERKLGMVFQDFSLWPHMTVFENVAYGLRATKRTKRLKEVVQDAIFKVQLAGIESRYPRELSGGQQQRVAFARAIAIQPQIILFDEPLSALDAVLREEMRLELMSLVDELGITSVYVTHDQMEAMSMSNEIIVMQQGEIQQIGSPEDIYLRPNNKHTAHFIGKSNWIGEHHMFRPEHLQWQTNVNGYTFQAIVKSVSYMGDRYEIGLETTKYGQWIGYHQSRLEIGSKVSISIHTDHLITLKQKEEMVI